MLYGQESILGVLFSYSLNGSCLSCVVQLSSETFSWSETWLADFKFDRAMDWQWLLPRLGTAVKIRGTKAGKRHLAGCEIFLGDEPEPASPRFIIESGAPLSIETG